MLQRTQSETPSQKQRPPIQSRIVALGETEFYNRNNVVTDSPTDQHNHKFYTDVYVKFGRKFEIGRP